MEVYGEGLMQENSRRRETSSNIKPWLGVSGEFRGSRQAGSRRTTESCNGRAKPSQDNSLYVRTLSGLTGAADTPLGLLPIP